MEDGVRETARLEIRPLLWRHQWKHPFLSIHIYYLCSLCYKIMESTESINSDFVYTTRTISSRHFLFLPYESSQGSGAWIRR